jgi:hypothetical protein
MDELKCKVSLKHMNTVNSVVGMLLTLNTQYGKWLDKDYKSIQKELDDASLIGYEKLLEVFKSYYGDYVEFIDGK